MANLAEEIYNALVTFYDFTDKTVLHVGAGGGQLVEYAAQAGHVHAIDIDLPALHVLEARIAEKGLEDKFTVGKQDYYEISGQYDVVFFDFCLHELDDPAAALAHAAGISRDTLILDHGPDSPWAWYVGETELVQKSWQAIDEAQTWRRLIEQSQQFFHDFEPLQTKLSSCGEVVQKRISVLKDETDITIPMQYGLALL